MNISTHLIWLSLVVVTIVVSQSRSCEAQIDRQLKFRIDSEMFVGSSKAPLSKNKTLFSDSLIFDFPIPVDGSAPEEIVVYDSQKKTISLLDMRRQIQLNLVDVQVENLLSEMREQMQQDDRSKLLLEQTFNERVDLDTRAVTLTGSQNMTYRFFGKPPAETKVLPAYFEFLNSFTRMQASDPEKFPPFARIRLNESIRKTGWMPERVEVDIVPGDFFKKPFSAHTVHKLTMNLTARDLEEIAFAKKNWAAFPAVSLTEYRRIETKKSFLARVAQSAKEKDEADVAKKR